MPTKREGAAEYFGVSVLPGSGQAVPYYLTPGKPIDAK